MLFLATLPLLASATLVSAAGARIGGVGAGDGIVKAGGPINNIKVNVDNVVQCATASISWSGTTGDVDVKIGLGGYYVGATWLTELSSLSGSSTTWTVNQEAGSGTLIFQVTDSTGAFNYIQNIAIGSSDDTSCLSGKPSSTAVQSATSSTPAAVETTSSSQAAPTPETTPVSTPASAPEATPQAESSAPVVESPSSSSPPANPNSVAPDAEGQNSVSSSPSPANPTGSATSSGSATPSGSATAPDSATSPDSSISPDSAISPGPAVSSGDTTPPVVVVTRTAQTQPSSNPVSPPQGPQDSQGSQAAEAAPLLSTSTIVVAASAPVQSQASAASSSEAVVTFTSGAVSGSVAPARITSTITQSPTGVLNSGARPTALARAGAGALLAAAAAFVAA